MKLSIKIILPIIFVAMCGMGIMVFSNYQTNNDSLIKAGAVTKRLTISNVLSEFSEFHKFNAMNSKSLSQTSLFQPYLSGSAVAFDANQSDAKTRVVNMSNTYGYARTGLADVSGKILRDKDSSFEGTNISNEPFFKQALTGSPSVGDPYLYNGRIVYTAASPIVEVGTSKVIGVAYNVAYLNDTVSERAMLGEYGYLLVASEQGTVFVHTNSKKIFKLNLSKTSWGAEILKTKKGTVEFSEENREKLAYYDVIEGLNWIVVATTDIDELQAPSTANGIKSLYIALGVLIVLLGVTSFVVIVITRGLNRAVEYSQEIANGNLDTELKLYGSDEIGQLADSLRTIPKVLKSITAEYRTLEESIRNGSLLATVDVNKFDGEFRNLVAGTNNILLSFRTVLDNIPSPVVVLNAKLEAEYLNNVAVSLTTTDYQGKKCFDLFRREDDSTEHDGLQKALHSKVPHNGETVAHPNGVRLDVRYNAIPLLDTKGSVTAILQLITDVTDFKVTQDTILRVADAARTISTQVATSSEELAAQLQTSEKSARTQAEQISSAANIMESMNIVVVEMALNAQEALDVSNVAKVEAENGSQVVQNAVRSIQHVQEQSHKLKEGMEQLHHNANAINDVITTISDIADQTNLLALNAAIEAARAGESGRGFAVVADEVRKLAEKTMNSTNEVSSAIIAIQKSVNASVNLVDDSVSAVEHTSTLVIQSGETFLSIVDMVEKTAEKANVIASGSDGQARSSDAVNNVLGEVSQLASETANGMEEASRAVVELSAQSQNLLVLIADMQSA